MVRSVRWSSEGAIPSWIRVAAAVLGTFVLFGCDEDAGRPANGGADAGSDAGDRGSAGAGGSAGIGGDGGTSAAEGGPRELPDSGPDHIDATDGAPMRCGPAWEIDGCRPCADEVPDYTVTTAPETLQGVTRSVDRAFDVCNGKVSEAMVLFVAPAEGTFQFLIPGFEALIANRGTCDQLCYNDVSATLAAGERVMLVIEGFDWAEAPFELRIHQIGARAECGGALCPPFAETATPSSEQCCTAGGACGAFFDGECVERTPEAPLDSLCPPEADPQSTFSGCCTAEGACGLAIPDVGLGCVAREAFPGRSLSHVACGEEAARYTNFESGQVRPLALSPDGTRLFAVNTPAASLEVFTVTESGLSPATNVAVGLEPVAVAARTNGEVWVVNHLSDSVSVVDVASDPPRVVETLWTGDEPRDIVFAGTNRERAFVTTAHRGQNHPVAPRLLDPGVGRADVWVFDAENLGSKAGGTPLAIVNLFGDTPRALAVTPDGKTVYAAVFNSGNRTTTLHESLVPESERPPPTATLAGEKQPSVGLILRHDGRDWVDETGKAWTSAVPFTLPDYDVFAIDATADPPAPTTRVSGVGTTIFDLAVNPRTGAVYASNSEARNAVRFEPALRGHFAESRITVILNGTAAPKSLNSHIDRGGPGTEQERALALALPLGMAVSADGSSLYVAAFGSSKIGVFETAALESDSGAAAAAQIAVSGGGPTGVVLDEPRGRLYVATRFDDGISVVNLGSRTESSHVSLFDPEPPVVREGRPFLYDATLSSGHGDSACGSCHFFGDMDHLAWDLGDPGGAPVADPNPIGASGGGGSFHPMKGPMTTQSLRGMANHGTLHWRGDRSGALEDGGSFFDTLAAFRQFNPAFVGLLGRDAELAPGDMQKFAEFALTLAYPPNPVRALDGSLTPSEAAGREVYFGRTTDGVRNCNGCHTLDAQAGFFGSDSRSTFENEPQNFKVPHLRNAYQKVGMFGTSLFTDAAVPRGEQIRGFGFLHDGSMDTLLTFFTLGVFTLTEVERRQVAEFVLAYDSELAPIVGQQVTLRRPASSAVLTRLALLDEQSRVATPRRACDLIAKGVIGGRARGYRRLSDGLFRSDRAAESPLPLDALEGLVDDTLTLTCVPPGSGQRLGVDRDLDGVLDGDDVK